MLPSTSVTRLEVEQEDSLLRCPASVFSSHRYPEWLERHRSQHSSSELKWSVPGVVSGEVSLPEGNKTVILGQLSASRVCYPKFRSSGDSRSQYFCRKSGPKSKEHLPVISVVRITGLCSLNWRPEEDDDDDDDLTWLDPSWDWLIWQIFWYLYANILRVKMTSSDLIHRRPLTD